MKRKITRLSTMSWSHERQDNGMIVALCEDGTVWVCEYRSDRGFGAWVGLEELPEDLKKGKYKK